MNDILIEGSDRLPTINLDAGNGVIEFAGRSIPEDGKEFYDEVLKWLNDYAHQPKDVTHVSFKLEYLNSSTHISIKSIFDILEQINKEHRVEVEWFYEADDPSMRDTAKDFKSICKLPFKIVPIDEFKVL